MHKSIALFVLLNCIHLIANGQKEYNNWFFGAGCGLDFSAGAPVYLPGGQISTDEGCSAMSDKNGNLLMYTDGLKVLDKTHNIMPNGSVLQGNSSSTQSALIVSAPGSNTLYYIFTTFCVQSILRLITIYPLRMHGMNLYHVNSVINCIHP